MLCAYKQQLIYNSSRPAPVLSSYGSEMILLIQSIYADNGHRELLAKGFGVL